MWQMNIIIVESLCNSVLFTTYCYHYRRDFLIHYLNSFNGRSHLWLILLDKAYLDLKQMKYTNLYVPFSFERDTMHLIAQHFLGNRRH